MARSEKKSQASRAEKAAAAKAKFFEALEAAPGEVAAAAKAAGVAPRTGFRWAKEKPTAAPSAKSGTKSAAKKPAAKKPAAKTKKVRADGSKRRAASGPKSPDERGRITDSLMKKLRSGTSLSKAAKEVGITFSTAKKYVSANDAPKKFSPAVKRGRSVITIGEIPGRLDAIIGEARQLLRKLEELRASS